MNIIWYIFTFPVRADGTLLIEFPAGSSVGRSRVNNSHTYVLKCKKWHYPSPFRFLWHRLFFVNLSFYFCWGFNHVTSDFQIDLMCQSIQHRYVSFDFASELYKKEGINLNGRLLRKAVRSHAYIREGPSLSWWKRDRFTCSCMVSQLLLTLAFSGLCSQP